MNMKPFLKYFVLAALLDNSTVQAFTPTLRPASVLTFSPPLLVGENNPEECMDIFHDGISPMAQCFPSASAKVLKEVVVVPDTKEDCEYAYYDGTTGDVLCWAV